ncbi:mucin-associated surface protein (MASP), putative [Trypanosoma cruzi marinkellei]|uniref:Mucin-associated surface protein (MASP), putative n=1 Tax=Trypanosoma cruzi marinkellei TaxID=85056 RepID=K2MRF4_TRYCR|nr:mucin-associated surface protein (MASP), putative [Trypanosoma cruzi marinkellei]
MAMMMTGRVLLVCALCVLWCGLSEVVADAGGGASDVSAKEHFLLRWNAQRRRVCAEEVSRNAGCSANGFAVEDCVRQGTDGVRSVVDSRSHWRHQWYAVVAGDTTEDEEDAKTKITSELNPQPQDSIVVDPGTNGSPGTAQELTSGGADSGGLKLLPSEPQNNVSQLQKSSKGVRTEVGVQSQLQPVSEKQNAREIKTRKPHHWRKK